MVSSGCPQNGDCPLYTLETVKFTLQLQQGSAPSLFAHCAGEAHTLVGTPFTFFISSLQHARDGQVEPQLDVPMDSATAVSIVIVGSLEQMLKLWLLTVVISPLV